MTVAGLREFFTLRGTGNRAVAGYMCGVVFFFSLIPIVVALGTNGDSPFLFNVFWRLGIIATCVAFLLRCYRSTLAFCWRSRRQPQFRRLVRRRFRSLMLWLAVLNGMDYALLALSIRFIDITAAAVLFEFWPIIFVILMAYLERKDGRRRTIPVTVYPLLALVLAGVVLVTLSQAHEGESLLQFSRTEVWVGAILALLGGVASACTAYSFRWASELESDLDESFPDEWGELKDSDTDFPISIFYVMVAFVVTNFFSVFATGAIGVASGETLTWYHVAYGLFGGAAIQAAGSILFRVANVRAENLGVNAIYYLTPLLTLAWLMLLGFGLEVSQWDLLIMGASVIIVSNLIINFDAEIRLGFKALILALWACGSMVYLRDGLYAALHFDQWLWDGSGYFEAVGLTATVFTLLLAFRVARLVSRTTEEQDRTFAIVRRLEMLVARKVVDRSAIECVLRIDDSKGGQEDVVEAYVEFRSAVADARSSALASSDNDVRSALSEVESSLDSLTFSKQQGPVLGELFALMVFAAIVIALSLFTRPDDVFGWSGVLCEMIGVMLSTVIVFLMANIWDLQLDRDHAILKPAPSGEYRVVFESTQSHIFERRLSIVIGIATIASFGILLWFKWISPLG